MEKPKIAIHNGEEVIVREMTNDEYAAWKINEEQTKENQEISAKRENERKSALAKLATVGLTEDEIAAL